LTPIIWHKIANGSTEAKGNGAGFYGKPYQPGAIVKNDMEYILFLRKGGTFRSTTPLQKALSMLNRSELHSWLKTFWTDIRGASKRTGHPACENDKEFVDAPKIKQQIDRAIDQILDWKEIHNSPLMKPYCFYSLLLATMHFLEQLANFGTVYEKPQNYAFERSTVITNLSQLSEALQAAELDQRFRSFIDANTSK